MEPFRARGKGVCPHIRGGYRRRLYFGREGFHAPCQVHAGAAKARPRKVRAAFFGDGSRVCAAKPRAHRRKRRAFGAARAYFSDADLRRGYGGGKEPVLSVRAHAERVPVRGGEAARVQQDRARAPLRRRDRDHSDGHFLRRTDAEHAAQAEKHESPGHAADPPPLLRARGRHRALEGA